MNNTRKSQVTLVVIANLLLFAGVGLAIWNGQDAAKHKVASNQTLSSKPVGGAAASTATVEARKNLTVAGLPKYPATTRSAAAAEAKLLAGRNDPMSPTHYVAKYGPKSELSTEADEPVARVSKKEESTSNFVTNHQPTVMKAPPPPPIAEASQSRNWVSDATSKMAGITVTAVIGNKAMLSLRREGSRSHDRPEVICLAAGEETRSFNNLPISVVSVEPYRVTLDVDGDRFVKSLPEIK